MLCRIRKGGQDPKGGQTPYTLAREEKGSHPDPIVRGAKRKRGRTPKRKRKWLGV